MNTEIQHENTENKRSRLETLNLLKSKFVSTVSKIYINSLKRDVQFREITVAEQKKLSRIMIDNENRKDIIYDAQCAVLKSICLDKDIDIYALTEFDKIKLLLLLYQRNMMKNEITFTCPECHTQNKIQLDFENAIHKLDNFSLDDVVYTYENANWQFDFTLAYPKISTVSKFYQSRYSTLRRIHDKTAIESLNTSTNIDYINLFIKKIIITDKINNTTDEIDTSEYTIPELLDFISVLPLDVLYSDNGIITYTTKEFITKINDVFDKHECYICGNVCTDTVDLSVEGFF